MQSWNEGDKPWKGCAWNDPSGHLWRGSRRARGQEACGHSSVWCIVCQRRGSYIVLYWITVSLDQLAMTGRGEPSLTSSPKHRAPKIAAQASHDLLPHQPDLGMHLEEREQLPQMSIRHKASPCRPSLWPWIIRDSAKPSRHTPVHWPPTVLSRTAITGFNQGKNPIGGQAELTLPRSNKVNLILH